jgi:hypothetical protein
VVTSLPLVKFRCLSKTLNYFVMTKTMVVIIKPLGVRIWF